VSIQIHKAGTRNKLATRREPYWAAPLAPGRFVGFRKIDAERGSWIARARGEDGKQVYSALGADSSKFGYDQAVAGAREWFASLDAGVVTKGKYTVEDACKDYIEDRRKQKGDKTADDAEWRFESRVYNTTLGRTELIKVRSKAIKEWRDGLKVTPSGANRFMNTLNAAFNLAVANRMVPATIAQEWRDVKAFKNADKRREIFLDLAQRRALLATATGAVRDLIEAMMLTGARPGELTSALRGAFDARTKTLKLSGKTGPRSVPLTAAAVTLFERLAKDKLPLAPLLTRDDGKAWTRAEWTELVRAAADATVLKDDQGEPMKDAKGNQVKLPAGVSLYVLRHSWITQAIGDGMNTLDVARLTGTSLLMIDKHYGHLVQTSADRLAKVQML
jgi:site-specific recombinase XerD